MNRIGSYKSGEEEGEWEWYNDSGQLLSLGFYRAGRKDGIHRLFTNGSVVEESHYDNGILIKTVLPRQDSKTLPKSATEKSLKIENDASKFQTEKRETFYANGLLESVTVYHKGKKNGLFKRYTLTGDLRLTGYFKNDKRDGEWKFYYPDGQIEESRFFKNGKEHGKAQVFYENGQLRIISFSKYGSKHGEWKNYYPDGQLKSIGSYEDNRNVGKWKTYYRNGKVDQIGSYQSGKKEGEWKWYDDDGQLISIGSYKAGQEEGIHRLFSNGILVQESHYDNGSLVKTVRPN